MKTVLLKQLEFLISYQTGFISSWERMVIFCSPPCGLTCLDFRRHRNIPSSRIESSNGRVLFRKALHLHVFRDLWQWHPTPILLPGKSHGWRSLVGWSMGSWRVGHDWVTSLSLFTFMHRRRKWQPTPVFLPGESQGREPGGLPSMGSHRVGHDWSDLAAAAETYEAYLLSW